MSCEAGGTKTWEVFVQRYQLYCLTGGGELVEARQFNAQDDLSAVQRARQSLGTSACEVWQSDRLVARLDNRRMIRTGPAVPRARTVPTARSRPAATQ